MKRWISWAVMAGCTSAAFDVHADEPSIDIKGTSLIELMNMKITSVSKTEERLSDAPAAVYVITHDDIRRSGVTSIPEALRLAPGVHVAREGAHSWAISIRGFNSDITNKLLVLIDGRSVYSPLFAGVFWDVQDTLLEDVERIEVISGPGGTLWGANAVNGVINIITRSAQDTLGGFAEFGGGNQEQGFAGLRYGGKLGEDAAVRGYLKTFSRDSFRRADGERAIDDWQMNQGGFRLDWQQSEADLFTVQGDIYSGKEDGMFRDDFILGTVPGPDFKDQSDVAGGNLLGRWERQLSETSDFQLQAYYDYSKREIPGTYDEARDTFDIDFQHHFKLGRRNDILWGLGYRWTRDDIDNTTFATFTPDSRSDETFSAFLQDKIDLWDEKLFLTLGSKFEHNDYTGFEYQPNARLSWLPTERQTLWAAVSRAVRTPARLNTDLRLTAPVPGLPDSGARQPFVRPGAVLQRLRQAADPGAARAGYRYRPAAVLHPLAQYPGQRHGGRILWWHAGGQLAARRHLAPAIPVRLHRSSAAQQKRPPGCVRANRRRQQPGAPIFALFVYRLDPRSEPLHRHTLRRPPADVGHSQLHGAGPQPELESAGRFGIFHHRTESGRCWPCRVRPPATTWGVVCSARSGCVSSLVEASGLAMSQDSALTVHRLAAPLKPG